jgi:serine/threonine protein kinase
MSYEDHRNSVKTPLSPGDQLDHYRLDGILARSNVATVFRATDLRHNRDVAIKVPNPEVESDPTFADWFRREQQTSELLDHSGVMKVVTDPDRTQAYIVMEWFDGKPLRQLLIEEKRLTPERAGRIAVNICDALEYLHSRKIIHGDLQPEHVLIGVGDCIKLIEFGGAAKSKARRLTLARVAQLEGFSDYISTEEVLGRRIGARSDIYALGLILYEMLTGKQPFPQHDPSDRLLRYPVPPREIDPAISPQLQEVIYRAIERKPENRYSGAREFAADLEHLDQVGVVDRPELRDWKKQHSSPMRKVLLYAAIALIPIVILGLLLYVARH